MQRTIPILALLASGCVANANIVVIDARSVRLCDDVPPDDADPRALTSFDDALVGYGAWSDDDTYGTVWIPTDDDFVPYSTDGQFSDLNGDLVWLSNLPWGVVTQHHGRWARCHGRWCWIPGIKRSGAWVTWKHEGGRSSWSPVAPGFVWRRGVPVRITPPGEPVVGERADSELALVPNLAPQRLDVQTDKTPEENASLQRQYRSMQDQVTHWASAAFNDGDDDWSDYGSGGGGHSSGGGGGGTHATSMTSYSSSGFSAATRR